MSADTFQYDFSKTYYENFISNRSQSMAGSGDFSHVYGSLWKELTSYTTIDGIEVDNGVDIKGFVQYAYNGDQPTCMVDKLAKEIGNLLGDIGQRVGLGDLGCEIGQVFYDIVDSITDVFGSFICTAASEVVDKKCNKEMIDGLKMYRDELSSQDDEYKQMAKYYMIVGPKIVEAINKDKNSTTIYKYQMSVYILELIGLAKAKQGRKFVELYLRMMDEMVNKYDIKVSKRFKKWVASTVMIKQK